MFVQNQGRYSRALDLNMSMNMNKEGRMPLVHILMATFEGERYLGEQLASIQAQTYPHWVLHVLSLIHI